MKTIKELVIGVHRAATSDGLDLTPSDVGHIVSLFMEGMIHSEPVMPALDPILQRIADECAAVRDEV